jgi:pimeloyl-ACP methyl ester carboxylesterase
MPTLIVWGDADRIIPVSHAHAAHDAMPGSRLEIFEGVGHFPHCESPERFVDAVARFVRETEPAPPMTDRLRELLTPQIA